MTQRGKLDRIDLKILVALQRNSEIQNVQLAELVGLSPSPCLQRVKRLETAGYITGYGAHVNISKLVENVTVFTEVTLTDHRREDFIKFEAGIRCVDELLECHLVSGGYDYLLRFIVRSVAHYQEVIEALVNRNIGISKYFSYVVLKSPLVRSETPIETLLAGSSPDGARTGFAIIEDTANRPGSLPGEGNEGLRRHMASAQHPGASASGGETAQRDREWIGTSVGFLAILSWSTLATLSAATLRFPPFQLVAMTFAFSGIMGSFLVGRRVWTTRGWAQPLSTWLIGGGGLFFYHAMYFAALRLAPPAETTLLNQLWPLCMALLSVAVLKEPLGRLHYASLLVAGGGAALMLAQSGIRFVKSETIGYGLGLACALVWGAYSIAMRARPEAPSALVAGYCLMAAVLATLGHFLFEKRVWPENASDFLRVALMALGPLGGAFFAWDFGMKRGNVALLGTLAFATPVLSTVCLVLLGNTAPTLQLAGACATIAVAAMLAQKANTRLSATCEAALGRHTPPKWNALSSRYSSTQ